MHSGPCRDIRIPANGLSFSGLAAGLNDAPLVLLLHGFPEFADSWRCIAARLDRAGFFAVAINQRGYCPGAMPIEPEAYGLECLMADVTSIAEALGHRRFHLVGHDLGGIVAWSLAARQPTSLASLTVVSTPHPDALATARRQEPDQARMSAYVDSVGKLGRLAERSLLAHNCARLREIYRGRLPLSIIDNYVERFSAAGMLRGALNWYRSIDFDRAIGTVSVPTLFIWGSADQALGEAAALGTAQHVAGPYRFERVEGGSHWLLHEHAEYVSTHIIQHVLQAADT